MVAWHTRFGASPAAPWRRPGHMAHGQEQPETNLETYEKLVNGTCPHAVVRRLIPQGGGKSAVRASGPEDKSGESRGDAEGGDDDRIAATSPMAFAVAVARIRSDRKVRQACWQPAGWGR
jgi:hypothetical protein